MAGGIALGLLHHVKAPLRTTNANFESRDSAIPVGYENSAVMRGPSAKPGREFPCPPVRVETRPEEISTRRIMLFLLSVWDGSVLAPGCSQ